MKQVKIGEMKFMHKNDMDEPKEGKMKEAATGTIANSLNSRGNMIIVWRRAKEAATSLGERFEYCGKKFDLLNDGIYSFEQVLVKQCLAWLRGIRPVKCIFHFPGSFRRLAAN